MQGSARRLIGGVASLAVVTLAYALPNEAHAASTLCIVESGCMAENCNGTNEMEFCRDKGALFNCGYPVYTSCNYYDGCDPGYRYVVCWWV